MTPDPARLLLLEALYEATAEIHWDGLAWCPVCVARQAIEQYDKVTKGSDNHGG